MMTRYLTLLLVLLTFSYAKSQCFLVPAEACVNDCGPLFYLQSDPPGTTYQWSISCGTITNDTAANPHTVCFNTPGTCTIQVIITIPGENPDTCSAIVEVLMHSETLVEAGVCEGDSIEINGTYYVTGMYTDTIFGAAANGCDSILHITVTTLPTDTTAITNMGCEGDGFSVVVNGVVYDESNPVGTEILTGSDGCDSIVNIILTFSPTTTGTYIYIGCQGDSFSIVINNVIYNESNPSGIETLTSSTGCDSIVTINLTFFPHVFDTITYHGCSGDGFTVTVAGNEYNEANPSGIDTLPGGCDTIIVIDLQFDTLVASLTLTGDQMCVSPAGAQYSWFQCDSILLPDTTECITVNGAGCVCVVVDNGFCLDTVCEDFLVCDLFCEIIATDGLCLGDSALLLAATNASLTANYNWTITLDSVVVMEFSSADSVWLNFPGTGCFGVQLEIEEAGCTSICRDTICVVDRPLADLCCPRLECDSCASLRLQFFGNPPWTFALSDGNTTDTISGITMSQYDHIVCPQQNTSVLYTLLWVQDNTGFCFGGIVNDTATVYLEPIPDASVTVSATTLCADQPGMDYTWTECQQTLVLSTEPCFTPVASGCYCLTISTQLTDCVDTTCVDFFITGTEGVHENGAVKVWYNSDRNSIMLTGIDRSKPDVTILLSDLLGRTLAYADREFIEDGLMEISLNSEMPSIVVVTVNSEKFRFAAGLFIPY